MALRAGWLDDPVKVLQESLDSVLPAVGGAVEELEQPDPDELEDILVNPGTREVTEFLETPTPDLSNLYRPAPPLFRKSCNGRRTRRTSP